MDPRFAFFALFALALLTGALAVDANPYDMNTADGDSTCANEWNNTGDDNVECVVVTGPDHLLAKPGPATYSLTGTPFVAQGGTGFRQSAFPLYITNVQVSVWAEWSVGALGTGFDLAVCNDRNLDGICWEYNNIDQLRLATSNEPVVGASCTDQEKDVKSCPNATDAEVKAFCMVPNVFVGGGGTGWNPGQLRVFIGAWAGLDPFTPNVGAGVSAGTYDVWMNMDGYGCTPAQCDDLLDNDADGRRDQADPDCVSSDDANESVPGRQ